MSPADHFRKLDVYIPPFAEAQSDGREHAPVLSGALFQKAHGGTVGARKDSIFSPNTNKANCRMGISRPFDFERW